MLDGLEVETWNPNGAGCPPLYGLRASLLDAAGVAHDGYERRVGFKSVAWKPCEGSPAAWSQERQAFALVTAARRCKSRFPSCGARIGRGFPRIGE